MSQWHVGKMLLRLRKRTRLCYGTESPRFQYSSGSHGTAVPFSPSSTGHSGAARGNEIDDESRQRYWFQVSAEGYNIKLSRIL